MWRWMMLVVLLWLPTLCEARAEIGAYGFSLGMFEGDVIMELKTRGAQIVRQGKDRIRIPKKMLFLKGRKVYARFDKTRTKGLTRARFYFYHQHVWRMRLYGRDVRKLLMAQLQKPHVIAGSYYLWFFPKKLMGARCRKNKCELLKIGMLQGPNVSRAFLFSTLSDLRKRAEKRAKRAARWKQKIPSKTRRAVRKKATSRPVP